MVSMRAMSEACVLVWVRERERVCVRACVYPYPPSVLVCGPPYYVGLCACVRVLYACQMSDSLLRSCQ